MSVQLSQQRRRVRPELLSQERASYCRRSALALPAITPPVPIALGPRAPSTPSPKRGRARAAIIRRVRTTSLTARSKSAANAIADDLQNAPAPRPASSCRCQPIWGAGLSGSLSYSDARFRAGAVPKAERRRRFMRTIIPATRSRQSEDDCHASSFQSPPRERQTRMFLW